MRRARRTGWSRSKRNAAILSPLLLAVACQDAPPAASTLVRDSAGIEIVEHPEGAMEATPVWTVSAEPVLQIGAVEGDPDRQFARLGDAIRLPDGSVVALDERMVELRRYDPDGRLLGRQGREGEGPGEYLRLRALWRYPGDSLAVWDERRMQVSVLTSDLEWSRSGVHRPLLNATVAGALADGRLLVLTTVLHGLVEKDYWLVSPGRADSITRLPFYENVRPRPDGGLDVPLWTRFRHSAAAGHRILSTSSGTHELEVRDEEGELRRLVRWHGPDLTVHPPDVQASIDGLLARVPPGERAERRRSYEAQPVNETWPAFSGLEADDAGNAWLMTWTPEFRSVPNDWTVVSPDGRLLGRVTLPAEFTPLDIGPGHVTGRRVDDLGVHHLEVYALERIGS